MRTTLTISDQVLAEVKALASRERRSLRETLELLLLRGLKSQAQRPMADPFVVTPFHCGFAPGVDPQRLNQALDEMDADAFAQARRASGR